MAHEDMRRLVNHGLGGVLEAEVVPDHDPAALGVAVAVPAAGEVLVRGRPTLAVEVGAEGVHDAVPVGAGEVLDDRGVRLPLHEVGLRDIEHGEDGEPGDALLYLVAVLVLLGHLLGAEPEDPYGLLALADLVAEALPLAEPGDAFGVGALAEDQQHVVEAVGVEPGSEREERRPTVRVAECFNLRRDRLVKRGGLRLLLLDAPAGRRGLLGGTAGRRLGGACRGGHGSCS